VQGEVAETVVTRPGVGGGDERPADAVAGCAAGHHQFADVAVSLAGEVGARPDADHARDPAGVGDHQDGAVPVLRSVERALQPAAPGQERFRLIPPRRDSLGEPRREVEDPAGVGVVGGAHPDAQFAHAPSLPPPPARAKPRFLPLPLQRNLSATPATAPIGVAGVGDRKRLGSLA
jgi:hypothetical protein